MANPIRARQDVIDKNKAKVRAKKKDKPSITERIVNKKFSEGGSRVRRAHEEHILQGDGALRGTAKVVADAITKGPAVVRKVRKAAKVAKNVGRAVSKSKSVRRKVGKAVGSAVKLGKRTAQGAALFHGAGMTSTAIEAALKSKLKQPQRLGDTNGRRRAN